MEKQTELRDPLSCLNKAGPFEPIFVLRAKDPVAPQILRLWAQMAINTHEEHKVAGALGMAEVMEKWRAANVPEVAQNQVGSSRSLDSVPRTVLG